MGNRAVITTEAKDVGVYLHWNGGMDSVRAFLMYCKLHGYRKPEEDDYGWAGLTQVIANFIGEDGCSVGVDRYENLDRDNGDNGVYIIRDWEIVGREFYNKPEKDKRTLDSVLIEIDDKMPVTQKLGYDTIMRMLKEEEEEEEE